MNVPFILLLSAQLMSLAPVEINSEDQELTQHLRYYSDTDSRLTPHEALAQLDLFKPLPDQSANFGLHPEPLWIAVRLKSQNRNQPYVLALSYPHLDFIRLTVFDKRGVIISQKEGGDRLPFNARYRPHRTLNFALNFRQAEEQMLLIRIETQGSAQVGMRLQTLEYFDEIAAKENAGNFLYYGVFLVMIILNVFWFITLKDRLYLPYIAYLIFYLAGQMSINGTLFQFLLPNAPELANTLLLFSLSLALGFATHFCSRFNELHHYAPRFSKFLNFIYLASFATALMSIFVPYRYVLAPVLLISVFASVSALSSGFIGVQNQVRSAKFFLLAWIAFLVGCIFFVLMTAGILPTLFITEYGMQIGSALEVTLLTLALGDRVRSIIADRDALTQRVARQTASLAEETQKRAKAEQELRESLEEKILLINDAAHHLNNPLNHISQANELVTKSEAPLRQQLRALLADAGDEAKEARQFFERHLDAVVSAIATIHKAVDRSALTVQLLRHLAKEHQPGVGICDSSELQELIERRELKLRLIKETEHSERLIGLPVLILFALETLASNYRQQDSGLTIRVGREGEPDEPRTTFRFDDAELLETHHLLKSVEAAQLLLKGFGKVTVSESLDDLKLSFRRE